MPTLQEELSRLQPVDCDAGLVFGGKASGTVVRGYADATALTPRIDPHFRFPEASRDVIVWFIAPEDPLYLFGPTGCGKSSCIRQLAARLKYPVFEVTGHGRLEFADLVGHLSLKDGSMTYEYGPLALAMRYGGLFLFNEMDVIAPDVASGLHGVLDGCPLCIPENGGELIVPHPLFRFAATANTNGGGDTTGLYQGTQRQNLAFADRFLLCEISYPDASVEEELLRERFPTLPPQLCRSMVDYANEIRRQFMGDRADGGLVHAVEVTFSTRSLLRWADLTIRYQPLARHGIQPITYALDRALAFRAGRETRAMLHELAQRMFPQAGESSPSTAGEVPLSGDAAIRFLADGLDGVDAGHCPKLHLRKTGHGPQGVTSKDWCGEARPDGMYLRFGRTGSGGQGRFVAADACCRQDPVCELRRRAARKLRDGYVLIHSENMR